MGEFIIRLALVHLLLDASTRINRLAPTSPLRRRTLFRQLEDKMSIRSADGRQNNPSPRSLDDLADSLLTTIGARRSLGTYCN
jgi:hypothetical protein